MPSLIPSPTSGHHYDKGTVFKMATESGAGYETKPCMPATFIHHHSHLSHNQPSLLSPTPLLPHHCTAHQRHPRSHLVIESFLPYMSLITCISSSHLINYHFHSISFSTLYHTSSPAVTIIHLTTTLCKPRPLWKASYDFRENYL